MLISGKSNRTVQTKLYSSISAYINVVFQNLIVEAIKKNVILYCSNLPYVMREYLKYLFLYAVHALNKLPYSKLDSKSVGIMQGVVFLTYSSLIASSEKGRSRLQQLVQWCGSGFDGLVIFDEVHFISFGTV